MTGARHVRRLLMAAGMLGALVTSSPAAAAPIVGVASVIDGDTIEIHGVRIRLHGIMRPRAASFAPARPASAGAVASRHPWLSRIRSGDRTCPAIPATPIATGGPSQCALPAAWI